MTKTMIPQTDAARELAELNALHIEQALIQARIDAALDRLLEADPTRVRFVPSYSVESRDGILPGSPVHVLHEEKHATRRSDTTWTKHRVHPVEACSGPWCQGDGGPRYSPDREFSWAYEGVWRLVAWQDGGAVIVREEAAA